MSAPLYLLAGGPGSRGSTPDPLLAEVFAASGRQSPSVAYVGAASGDDRKFFSMLSTYMKKSGAGSVSLVRLAGRKPDLAAAREQMGAADIVFMSGGDVEEGMSVVERTGAAGALTDLFRAGKPFFGLSAGSIMMAPRWIRWRDPDDEASAELFPCLGFAPALIDTHGEADGWGELVALLGLEPEGAVGYGIPTGAGLRVAGDGCLSAVGGALHRYAHRGAAVVRIEDLAP